MARFCDGPAHVRRRRLAERELPYAAGLAAASEQRTAAALPQYGGEFDVMALARTVPAEVLAEAVGVSLTAVPTVATLVGRLCDALTSAPGDADEAASALLAALAPVAPGDERRAALAGLLFQARDATAALIGSAVLHEHRDPAAAVDQTLRLHAPVQRTRRTAVDDTVLGGVRLPRGTSVWVVLAAAEQGPPSPPATFGSGPHACPGAAHAVALATGFLTALRAGGWRVTPGRAVEHEPRPNLRLPVAVLVGRP